MQHELMAVCVRGELTSCSLLTVPWRSVRLYLNIRFVENETVSFVDASAFVSCHMPFYEELLSEGQCRPKREEWDKWQKVEEVEESLWGWWVATASEGIKDDLRCACTPAWSFELNSKARNYSRSEANHLESEWLFNVKTLPRSLVTLHCCTA